jgi:tetratricopeptide (TPR) repeat protein
MMDAVHRFEGTVNQVLGDGIMALFGAPIAHEDHALRACYAALAVQSAIRTYAEAVRCTHGILLQLRVGLNALRGEVWDKVLVYHRQAGERAMGQSAHREAVEYFEQALRALSHLLDQQDTREQAIDLRFALRSPLQPLGDFECILVLLREAEALAAALDDPRRLGQASLFLSRYFSIMGAYDQAIAAGQRALAHATASGDVVLHAQANQFLGVAYHAQGGYSRAIDHFMQTVMLLEGGRRHERFGQVFLPAVFSRAWLSRCHAELDTFAEGSSLGGGRAPDCRGGGSSCEPYACLLWDRSACPPPRGHPQGTPRA